MLADGAGLHGLLAFVDEPAVAAAPSYALGFGEDPAGLKVLQQSLVPLFVLLLDLRQAVEQAGDFLEALLPCDLRHAGVHAGPFVVLTAGRFLQIGRRVADAFQQFQVQLGVLLLLIGRLLEEGGDLLVAFLLGHGGEIGVLVAGLGLAGKGVLEVLLGPAALQFSHSCLLSAITKRSHANCALGRGQMLSSFPWQFKGRATRDVESGRGRERGDL